MMSSPNPTKTIDLLLASPATKDAMLRDAESVLGKRVSASRGLAGVAVRAGYAAFRRVQPGIVRAALERLAPHFAPVMDEHWARANASSDAADYFAMHAPTIASDLLAVTDGMARKANNAVLTSIYRSLRGRAEDEVAAAMPDVAGLLQRHLG